MKSNAYMEIVSTDFAEVSTKLHEMPFFRQFKDHDSGRKHGN